VRWPGGPFGLRSTASATLMCLLSALGERQVRPVHDRVWDPSVMLESLAALRKLGDQAGATMFYSHDPAQ
jgi:hypothetical protein